MFLQVVIITALAAGVGILIYFAVKLIAAPKKVDALQKLFTQGKYTAVEKAAKSLLAKEPDNFLAHYWLGKAYLAEKRTEIGFMELKLVNQNAIFGPELSEVTFRREISQLYLQFNHQQDALREFLLLTKLEPTNADNYYNAGKIYEQQNRSDMAFGFYKKAIQYDRRHSKAHARIGLILLNLKKYPEAKKEIDLALSISSDTYSNYYYLGKILKETKDYGGAIKAFEKAQRDTEYRQKALIERGICFMLGNMIDNAIPEFQRAIELDKGNTKNDTLHARYFLAACYEKVRKIEKALEQWEKIYAKNHAFRDVTTKLSEYKDIQQNDSLKDYLTSNDEELAEICKKTVQSVMGMIAQDVEVKKWGCQLTAVEGKGDNWMNVRKQLYLIRFYREPEPIEDGAIRETLDLARQMKCVKAFALSSSGFTRSASSFAESRPIELVGKEKLEAILQRAGA
ncbi:MAG: tetratricopeptide repeat protein [Treponema sp.]|nr:tetratricopeptide repeat protein [Treponema sp.]